MTTPDQSRAVYDETTPSGSTYGESFSLKRGSLFSLHIINAGLTGTITLWASNLDSPGLTDDTDWVQITDVTFTALSGASKEFINAGNAAGRFYRIKYAQTSGTGNLAIWANYGEA